VARKDKERKNAAQERLEGLLVAGDWHAAKREARKLEGSSVDGERAAAERALSRLRPGPTAILAFVAGLVFLAAVAVAGLRMR
jgi:hypothetical protein